MDTATILVVDDDPLVRSSTTRFLKSSGYRVACAVDGEEALVHIQAHHPDLVLMDVNMPRLDGIDALRRIKADPALASTWVVIVSGSRVDTDSQAHGLEAGADGYIARPISNRELLARVQSILRIKAAEDAVHQLNTTLEERVQERTRELKDAQEKLLRQERLALLGQMAGSVAHELRSPLAVISNAVYYLQLAQPEADEKFKEYLAMIKRETQSAEKIIADLLDFSRIRPAQKKPAFIPDLVDHVLQRHPPFASIHVSLDLPAGLPAVNVDPEQIEQVLGNLVLNACQAMEEKGELAISASLQEGWMLLSVRDTASGIPAENMGKIFEPLFTTKPRGIGLGLPISKFLVEANGGRIDVESTQGVGSTFKVTLPLA